MTVIVPDGAMSAGTIFALSADRIMMDYFSCLGPIDPQIEKDDNSYVRSYFDLLKDYMVRHEIYSFVHAKGYFQA